MKNLAWKIGLFVLILTAATASILHIKSTALNEHTDLTQLDKDRTQARTYTPEELEAIPTQVDLSNLDK